MPFDSLKFRYSWRPYQQRVLDSIDQHLDDDRLHVVAAPGAGKTTVGSLSAAAEMHSGSFADTGHSRSVDLSG